MKRWLLISLLLLVFVTSCTLSEEQNQATKIKESIPELPKGEVNNNSSNLEESTNNKETQIEPEPVKDPNLIAHWTFNEDANDETGKYKGTLIGGAKIQDGKIGNAIYLDGVDDYVEFSQKALEDVGTLSQGTISFWFNYESLLDTQTVMPIFYIGNKQGDPDNMYVIEIGHSAGDGSTNKPDPNDKRIYSTWIKNNREPFLCFDSGNNIEENTWHHYVVVVGPEGNQGYINGVLMENTDHNFGNSNEQYFLDSIGGKEIFLLGYGRSSFMISPEFVHYKGLVDDLRVYDKPLELIEIQELYSTQN